MTRRKSKQVDRRFVPQLLEAALIRLLVVFVRLLPLDWASALGGFVGRTVGTRLPISRRAHRNLRLAFPKIGDAEVRRITRAVWDNIGRTFAEFPHLKEIAAPANNRVEVVGAEHAMPLKNPEQPGIFVTGHFANWEVAAAVAHSYGLGLSTVVREPNNALVGSIVAELRREHHELLVPKGTAGARLLVASLRKGGIAALLVDQKLNSGISVPFFGIEAKSTPAPAQLALRFRCPILPLRVERLGGARFRMTLLPPLALPDSGDQEADVRAVTAQINAIFEDWIRDRPGDWFWLHRRWPKEAYAVLDREPT